jgi:hypothetical protein
MPFGFRRPLRRWGPPLFPFLAGASLLEMRPRRMLRVANRLFESGQFAQAAPMLETLANRARQQGFPRAPFLFVRAARANLLAGQAQQGVALFRIAFEILAGMGAASLLFPAARRIVDELMGAGNSQAASEIQNLVSAAPGWEDAPSPAHARPSLPTHCPQCGAGMRSDEAQWIDATTAECPYCGSSVR